MSKINQLSLFLIGENQNENCKAYLDLVQKGFHPHSAICEQYLVELYRVNYNGVAKPEVYKEPDYVAEDLAFLEGRMKGHSISNDYCQCDSHFLEYHDGLPCGADSELGCKATSFDRGVVAVVLPSAIPSIEYFKTQEIAFDLICYEIKEKNLPYSIGVITIFRESKLKHILCIPLNVALTQPEDHWEGRRL